jgi:hypothetical protein
MDSRRALINVLNRANPRSRNVEQRVRQRVAAGQCLSQLEIQQDGEWVIVDCDQPAGKRRGLCPHCYSVFLTEVKRGTPQDSFEYEQTMIREGLILADREKFAMRQKNMLSRRRRA